MNIYKVTKELEFEGFSVNSLNFLISRNNGSHKFSTLEYFIIYIVFEKTEVIINNKLYSIEANNLAFISPHKNIEYKNNSNENTVIAFSSSFFEKSANDSIILNSELFFNQESDLSITPTLANNEELKKLILERLNLYKEKSFDLYITVAHNCVEILLLDGLLAVDQREENQINLKFTYIEMVNKFRLLLQKYYKNQKSVLFYSDKLNVSPQRLSVATNTILKKGAKKMIVEKISNEAIMMLKNSLLNISEISVELGFIDEANFSTFVKKNLGKSPSEIRNHYSIMKKTQ